MKRFVISLSILVFALCSVAVAQRGTYSIEDLLKVRRVSDPRVSPDGKRVAFVIGDVSLDANKAINQIYVVGTDGSGLKQITNNPTSSSSPRWSPDGKRIAYISGGQIWIMDADGGHRDEVTKISTSAAGPVWSPDGKWIGFTSEVYPDCNDDACNKKKDEQAERNKVKAHVTERLLFRHWDEWRDVKRTHVFVVAAKGGDARDITPGDFDSPPYAASGVDIGFSPDSQEIAYVRNPDKVEAISTNSDIYVVSLNGGSPRNITAGNHGYDVGPIYTSNGKYILYRSQLTPGFEADRWRLMRYDRVAGTSIEITKGFDQQVEELAPTADGSSVYFTANEKGQAPIYKVSMQGGTVQKILDPVFAGNLQVTSDGKTLVFASSSLGAPPEVYRANSDGSGLTALSSANSQAISRAKLMKEEEVWWTGAMNKKIHGYLVKPGNFDPAKTYPLIVLIHGGPQSAWNNSWSYRWNPQVFANAGYIVFAPNPRGSTGYGQKFVDEISGDWGGKAYVDIMNGVAEVIRRNKFIDKNRIGAAGASYGGYMINWIEGHNSDPRFRFKVLVCHDGVYNLSSMYGATEEVWFPEWEFKGTPWTNKIMYERWSPDNFVKNFKTPILIVHGELDYRVPIDQGLQLYTAVQRMGVDSKLVIFPDEGHWVLKPLNSQFWYHNVLGWLDKYLMS
jgi:dipeptidyl aminopeptidase/acylaminoacyl peptidase